jgi:hypothetical protein
VESAAKRNHIGAAGRLAGQLHRRLDRLSAAIAEEKAIQRRIDHLTQRADQLKHGAVVDDIGLAVQQQPGLLADRRHDARVAMAGVGHADPTGEIQVAAPIGAVEAGALSTLDQDIAVARPDGGEILPILKQCHR